MWLLRWLHARRTVNAHRSSIQTYIRQHRREMTEKERYFERVRFSLPIKLSEKDAQTAQEQDSRLKYLAWEKEKKKMDSFSATVRRKMQERGMTANVFYRRARIDRKLFSKLKTDFGYQPNRKTAIRCCLALELDLTEAEELLKKAGYALSDSSSFDLAIRYCIECGIYDLMEVNMLLDALEEPILN